MTTTRVAVVADSSVLRAGLRALLADEAGLVVVSAFAAPVASTDDGRRSLRALVASLDVAVLVGAGDDVHAMLGILPSGGEAVDEPGAAGDATGQPALVLLVDRPDPAGARRALRAGASAVLSLDAGEPAILAAVHAAAAGLVTLPRALAAALQPVEVMASTPPTALRGSARRDGATPNAPSLTPREREVLALLAQGLANKAIAPRLGITEHTVKAHVAAIYEKVGAGNRAEAAVAAARMGLLML